MHENSKPKLQKERVEETSPVYLLPPQHHSVTPKSFFIVGIDLKFKTYFAKFRKPSSHRQQLNTVECIECFNSSYDRFVVTNLLKRKFLKDL